MKHYSPAIGMTLSLLLFSTFWVAPIHAQDTTAAQEATLVKAVDQYRLQHLQEKLFVHTDKEFYLAGEICWFKLYNVDAGSHRPVDISKVAYLEWLDKNNKPVLQAKVGLRQGHGDGSLYLPLTLRSGNYKLRAYTSWMKNYGADWFFEKTIEVVNARKSAEVPITDPPLQYNIVFFPEGGNLVENIACKVAFKATDQYGRGIECTGVVTDDDEDTVIRYKPLRFGIGSFILTPRSGHRYRSTIRLADGTAISKLLPAAYKEGIVMRVSKEGNDGFRVDLQSGVATGLASGVADSRFYLIAHTRQSVKLAEVVVLKEGKASFLIDKNKLGEGITHLTVFDAARQPVCERLIFKAPSRRYKVAMNADQDSYATRKKINLQISLTGPDNKSREADCSLSVYRLDSLQGMPAGHLESYLWLSSDLKGKIESPDYYFDHPEDEEAMDNLMISHGWRRFHWEEVLHPGSPSFEFPPEYNGAIISGRIVNARTGKPGRHIQGYFSVPGTRTQFSSSISDDEGRVKFELKDFYGSREVVVQTNPLTDSMFRMDIANPFLETYTDVPLSPFVPPLGSSLDLTDKSVAMQALNRYAGEKLKRFYFPAADTSAFYYKPDYTYALDDYTRFTTMEEVMREYVVLMLVKNSHSHFHLPLFDIPNNRFFDVDPLILVDGVPVFDIDKLMVLDPLKIRKLDMLHRKYFLGGTDYNGIMNWITYKGDLGGYVLDPNATVIDYEGLELQREFYSPSYATEQDAASHLPDFRNVLYWSPVVPTDTRGKGMLSFYSSDVPGHYVVVLEGLAPDGTAVSNKLSFEVK
ncbi:MAG TPA: hypothetical protein VNS58_13970 [Puia sp.]|nr:hypothetical protein [Puia sp.]